jgi:hypothetical protein
MFGVRTPDFANEIEEWASPFGIVNEYGLFATMTTHRPEISIEGSNDGMEWQAYEFRYKPGPLNRAPRWVAPEQPRLDWQMWFASMSGPNEYPWTLHLVWKLLHNDPGTLSLFGGNPFPGKPPRYVRAVLYRYKFAQPGNPEGDWWKREELGIWLPALSAEDPRLLDILKQEDWH